MTRLLLVLLVALSAACERAPATSAALTGTPFVLVVSPATAQPRNDASQEQPYFDGDGWLVQRAVLPLRYPIQLEAGAVITGWTLDLWREDEGPNTSAVLERLDRVVADPPGNETELHERITSPVHQTGPAPLAKDGLSVPVDDTGSLSLAVRGSGIAGDRALSLYVSGYRR